MNVLSFRLSGQFAAFRDPSVTSNQIVYHVPSKSAVIGLLGAIIGVQRDDNSLGSAYGSNYTDLFSKTMIGMRYEYEARKITYYTNHRSFENETMKPFKKELLENPRYRIFVLIDNELEEFKKLKTSIFENRFVYSPYLGHTYCPAVISDPKLHWAIPITGTEVEDEITDCVILDESGIDKLDFTLRLNPESGDKYEPMIERHLHHFHVNNNLESRVLKYWIPVDFSSFKIDRDGERQHSRFYKIDNDKVVCMF